MMEKEVSQLTAALTPASVASSLHAPSRLPLLFVRTKHTRALSWRYSHVHPVSHLTDQGWLVGLTWHVAPWHVETG
jgi:hypothetical protein